MKHVPTNQQSEDAPRNDVHRVQDMLRTLPPRIARDIAIAESLLARIGWLPYALAALGFAAGLSILAGACAASASENQLCMCLSGPALGAATGAYVATRINAVQYTRLAHALRIRADLVPLLRQTTKNDPVLAPVFACVERLL